MSSFSLFATITALSVWEVYPAKLAVMIYSPGFNFLVKEPSVSVITAKLFVPLFSFISI